MKNGQSILILLIILLSILASLAGLMDRSGSGPYAYQAITGETVQIYGEGIYRHDSVSTVAQGKASDLITLVVAVPLLILSIILTNRRSFRGKLLLSGTLGYFLYTYMSYTFLWTYNPFFIVYVILMSLSLFAFILCLSDFDLKSLPAQFNPRLPVKFLGGYQIFIAVVIGMLWLGKILPSVLSDTMPVGLEHYTTLVIQGMDLGFLVPSGILSGLLLMKKKPLGYLLSSVLIMKSITMLTAISAMLVNMMRHNVQVSLIERIIFPAINLVAIVAMFILLKNAQPGVTIQQSA
ncbi:MAG: hypothetical protein PHC86_07325 [Eubacteriales bacterium]|nr:hypothetical protein [Eubacteriales bacterium]